MNDKNAWLSLLERYGFGLALAAAVLWFVRVDIVVPMVAAHQAFLKEVSEAQRDIAAAMREQTMILNDLRRAGANQDIKSIP